MYKQTKQPLGLPLQGRPNQDSRKKESKAHSAKVVGASQNTQAGGGTHGRGSLGPNFGGAHVREPARGSSPLGDHLRAGPSAGTKETRDRVEAAGSSSKEGKGLRHGCETLGPNFRGTSVQEPVRGSSPLGDHSRAGPSTGIDEGRNRVEATRSTAQGRKELGQGCGTVDSGLGGVRVEVPARGSSPMGDYLRAGPSTGTCGTGKHEEATRIAPDSKEKKEPQWSGAGKRYNRKKIKRQPAVGKTPLASNPTEGPSKRLREISDEATIVTNDVKRARTQGSFKDALVGTRMAIVAENFPATRIAAEQMGAIQEVIWDQLENTPDPLPVINVGNIVGGALHVTCEGEASVTWLRALNGKTAEGINLKVIDAKDLPKPVKMAWKTRNVGCTNTVRVLKMLQRLNPEIDTVDWKVVDTCVEGNSTRRVVYMDQASADVIKGKSFCLLAGLDRSVFKILEDAEKRTKEPAPEGENPAPVQTGLDPGTGDPGLSVPYIDAPVPSPASSTRTESIIGDLTDLLLHSPVSTLPPNMETDALSTEEAEGGNPYG